MNGPVVEIRELCQGDRAEWLSMRVKLWSIDYRNERKHSSQMADIERDYDKTVFLAFVNGQPVGFAECSVRSYVDGCESSPVGYLEGIFVEEPFRRQGVGRELVEMVKSWSREKGCREMGSDSDIQNEVSYHMHLALGFHEVERVINWRIDL